MSASATCQTDLYRQIVLEHSRHPRNCRRPESYDLHAEGHNPLCGDKVHIYVSLADGLLKDIAFEASGCAICLASASLMTAATLQQSRDQAEATISGFERALTTDGEQLPGDLAALGGVRQYPSRIRCATLPWHTLRAALAASTDTVTTE